MILEAENFEPTAALIPAPATCAPVYRPGESPAVAYLSSLSTAKSRRAQAGALKTIAALFGATVESMNWAAMTYTHSSAVRAALAQTFAPATCNRFICALRGTLHEAKRLGLMTSEQCGLASDIKSVKGTRLQSGRALSLTEIRRLIRAATKDPLAGNRDAALLAFMYCTGARRAEVVSLDLTDWRAADGSVVFLGKGNRERIGYVGAAREHFDRWLEQREPLGPGPIFLPVDKAGTLVNRRLSEHGILTILARMAKRAGVDSFRPHDVRRTCVSALLEAGADLAAVQAVAGHQSIATTARYDRRGEAAKLKASKLLKL